jgi:hypothetical protein
LERAARIEDLLALEVASTRDFGESIYGKHDFNDLVIRLL